MYKLISTAFLLGLALSLFSQNPHGAALKLDCASCHSPAGWEIAADHWQTIELQKPTKSKTTGMPMPVDTSLFHHNKTNFPLQGRHAAVECRDCHETLVFEGTKADCNACHLDIHQQTAGNDCARCHTTNHWLVDNVQEIHFDNGFPLTGVHRTVGCAECHVSESAMQFGRNGNLCVDCHLADFNATTNPNHPQAGFSTDCLECHDLTTDDWNTDKVDHSFFPLTKGHEVSDCVACHTGGDFANTPNNCAACHQPDFDAAQSPNHVQAGFSNDCAQCHTTDLDWQPAQYLSHDGEHFPIYSGSHKGVWNSCTECHTDPNNYAVNSCTTCHINPETDDGHTGVVGYVYENSACLACHPTGEADGAFNHNNTAFPLTGAHLTTDCIECHANGYAGTPTDCASCHNNDFNQTANPPHGALGLSNDCASCHTTDPGWAPASFAIHNDFYVLNGAHATIANDCAACHNGDYVNTPNTCIGCHTPDFNAVADPNHVANQFPTDCTTCHSETAWIPSTFDHNTVWPFTGEHIAVANDCAACHIGGNYSTTPTDCAGCHTPDFTGSVNPNHVALNLPNDCALCHTTAPDWEPAAFPLHNDFYPLNGAHAMIANQCATCHNGDYNNTPNTCFACHAADFNATTSPNHVALQFSQDCATCHSETTWSPATFDHDVQHFPIYSGAHNGEWNACTDCHTNPSDYMQFTCTTCHANPETNDQHNGVGGYVYQSDACFACHPSGDATNIFDHNTTAFPLTGAHTTTECLECHATGFENTPTDCAACHTTDFNGSTNPNHVALGLPMDCASCHTTQPDWAPATFAIHNQFYPLNGAHAMVANDCATCHNGNYNNTPNTCIGCHTPDFNAAVDPNHVANQFPQDCATCHSESAWVPSSFNHNSVWPFTGAHTAVAYDCIACHVGGNYTTTPTDCASCHQADFAQSANPNHTALGLPTDCAMCHTTTPDWQPAAFPIHQDFYPLNGAHAMIANDCATCHNGNYYNTPNTCFACHTSDYNGTTNPNHQSAQFPTDCASCHGENTWVPATFDHDAQHFPIYSGGHNGEWNQCIDCHSNPNNYAEVVCTTCHVNPETNDQHAGVGGYSYSSPACLACHPTGDATNVFDHATVWPLTGAHVTAECMDCHVGGVYQGTPTDCAACHQTDYNGSTNPNHGALGLSNDCASCHTTAPGWAPASFAVHNQFYPLNGAHAMVANDCAACHNGNYNNTPNTCIGCHTSDFNGTTDPDHEAGQFPTDCATCHSESAWIPSTFNHNTVWPITGAHLPIANDCAECHIGGNYNNTPNTCSGCHTPDFNQSQNPPHVSLGLPNDCAMCHTTAPDWQPASFPIHNQFYPLNGAHATIANDCAACHNGNYNNTPNTCYACHTADFNGTTNPNHQQAGFSQDCATCHSETAWVPANFDHDAQYFPIYSGAHDGEWDNCTDCHNNPNNFAEFTCTTCHANPETNNQHNGVNGYSYNSPACFACHPNGEGDGFDHNTIWPLTGAHATADCLDCHANGYAGTPTDCAACHTTDYNASANPDHEALMLPTDCASCHTTAPGWAPATFAIHDQFYPLTGAHAPIANDCAACHIGGNYNNTPNTCAGCHQPDFNASTNPNHSSLALPNDCAMCHTTAPDWQPATFPIHNQFYQLNGAHATIANDCAACHNGNYNNTPTTCVGCHLADYNATTNPDHETAGFPTTCNDCHTETAWAPATFDHTTIWPLTGAHQAIANQCTECHIGGNYNNTPNTCVGCHQPDFNSSTNPNHVALGIPTDCAMCHTTAPDWEPATFPIHNQFYQLNGAHATIANDCAACHNGNYNNTPNTCVGCHLPDYNGTTNPDHQSAGFPTTCNDCHTETAWVPATFNHNSIWPITGAHIPIANDCAACHIGGNYNNTPNTCQGCHQPDYNGSTNPNHGALGIPTNCELCHTTAPDWQPATFPIHDQYYVLAGAHVAIANQCAECHNGNYNNTPNTCIGCHLPDYNGATNPNHAAAQFPTTCQDCHSQSAWVPSTFDHNAIWPMTGAHIPIANQCTECHIGGNYNNTPNTCVGCHQPDYNGSTNPNHSALGIPTDCAMCHTTDPDWNPATFPIHSQYWPLNGAHATIANDCAACHNGNYNNTPNTCFGCHSADYNGANNPDHQQAGFPTTCQNCHSENAWTPATWDHDGMYFPIYSGKHEGEWNTCVECHTTAGNFSLFSCIDCHEHDDQNQVDDDHQGVSGYQYNSAACYSCHPTGED